MKKDCDVRSKRAKMFVIETRKTKVSLSQVNVLLMFNAKFYSSIENPSRGRETTRSGYASP